MLQGVREGLQFLLAGFRTLRHVTVRTRPPRHLHSWHQMHNDGQRASMDHRTPVPVNGRRGNHAHCLRACHAQLVVVDDSVQRFKVAGARCPRCRLCAGRADRTWLRGGGGPVCWLCVAAWEFRKGLLGMRYWIPSLRSCVDRHLLPVSPAEPRPWHRLTIQVVPQHPMATRHSDLV